MLFLHVLSHDTTPNICISIFVDVDFLKQDFLSYTHHNIDSGGFQWPPFTISNDFVLYVMLKLFVRMLSDIRFDYVLSQDLYIFRDLY